MARVAGQRRRPVAGESARPVAGEAARPAAGDPAPPVAGEPEAAPHLEAARVGPGDLAPDLLVVGRIGKPQGIRGEVTIEVRTDDPEARFADGATLLTEPAERGPLVVTSSRTQNGRLVVNFEGVPDRTAAERLRDTLLQVDAATLPPPEDDDEFHDHVLRGMAALLPAGARIGRVADVLHLPHGDVLVVRRDDNGAEVLVPFVKAMVPEVDVAGRTLVVDPPEGLLDLTDTDTDTADA